MQTLVGAIHEKYDESSLEAGGHDDFIQVFVPKSGPRSRSHGTDKLNLPARLTLDKLRISTAGEAKEISDLCAHVTELDLTNNLISEWKEVFTILEHMPCLQFLNLTVNQLKDMSLATDFVVSFPKLQYLVLNNTGVSWSAIAILLSYFPSLTELHLSLNKYRCVDLPPEFVHNSLVKLFINNCDIDNWSDISKLGSAFPCLQSLNIIQNDISRLSVMDEYSEFPVLSALNISKSPIESWQEVDKLRRFPTLRNLRIADIPFIQDWEAKQRRQHLVARLPNITHLNGSAISETERVDAEHAFIRYFTGSPDKPVRFDELEEIYGKLVPLVHVDLKVSNYLNMLVKFEDKAEYMDIYLHQTLAEFRKLLQNFTRLRTTQMRVFYVEMYDGNQRDTTELKLPNKTLLSLNMKVGDEIHIDKKYTG